MVGEVIAEYATRDTTDHLVDFLSAARSAVDTKDSMRESDVAIRQLEHLTNLPK